MSEETKSISDYITELTEKATELQSELMELENNSTLRKKSLSRFKGPNRHSKLLTL